MTDTGSIMNRLAKVDNETLDGQVSTDAARDLFTSIVAGDVTPAHEAAPRSVRRGKARLAVAAALVTGAAAAAVVLGPGLFAGPDATVYANSAIEVQREGGEWVARIKDPYADHRQYTEAFAAVGLDVALRLVPSSPSGVGKLGRIGASASNGGSAGSPESGSLSGGLAVDDCVDCWMTLRVSADFTGHAEVRIGRAAKPGESYENATSAAARGEALEGVPVRDGRTVAELLPEIRKRNLAVTYSRVLTNVGVVEGVTSDGVKSTGTSLSFEPLSENEVGRDWRVWDAEPVKPGLVRLLVTEDRLPKNPLYNF
ncbi:hypothetical protein ACFOY2_48190 [Nonomuraea purpurea]|uniref:DUF4179 domain-containing protein n=1 Tax=Nonomuraea purpurea TaxID=1849276 RepID=A0ABV8GQ57_9ACTN